MPGAADWFVEAQADWSDKVAYGPPGFDSYVRIPYDMTGEVTDGTVMERALSLLAEHTTTPQHIRVGIWIGWGMSPEEPVGEPFRIPNRDYVLVHSSLDDVLAPPTLQVSDEAERPDAAPHLVWPADRAWFIASDVDPEWFGIGASHAAIDSLLGDMELHAERSPYGSHKDIEW